MKGFIGFIREQGVVGLAVGFILGGAVSKLVASIVTDMVNPLITLALGSPEGLVTASFSFGSAKFLYGDLLSALIDFLAVALVVYYGFKALHLHKLDKPKS